MAVFYIFIKIIIREFNYSEKNFDVPSGSKCLKSAECYFQHNLMFSYAPSGLVNVYLLSDGLCPSLIYFAASRLTFLSGLIICKDNLS